MAERWVELADKDGSFYDPQTGFVIARGKQVRLTKPIGRLTAAKITGKGIVDCDPPAAAVTPAKAGVQETAPPDPGETDKNVCPTGEDPAPVGQAFQPATPETLADVAQQVIERRIETLQAENTAAQLRDMADTLGLAINPRANKRTLATEIAEAEWQREHRKREE